MGEGGKEIVIGGTFAASEIGHIPVVSLWCKWNVSFTNAASDRVDRHGEMVHGVALGIPQPGLLSGYVLEPK